MRTILCALALCVACFAQHPGEPTPPKPTSYKPITSDEKIAILKAQKAFLTAQDAVKQTPQFGAFIEAQNSVQKAWQEVLTSRKLTSENTILCDGPGPGPCSDVPAGDFAVKPKPEPEVKK
jgi:hypothetical protein